MSGTTQQRLDQDMWAGNECTNENAEARAEADNPDESISSLTETVSPEPESYVE